MISAAIAQIAVASFFFMVMKTALAKEKDITESWIRLQKNLKNHPVEIDFL